VEIVLRVALKVVLIAATLSIPTCLISTIAMDQSKPTYYKFWNACFEVSTFIMAGVCTVVVVLLIVKLILTIWTM